MTDISNTPDYDNLLNSIDSLWAKAKENAVTAINTELLDANWATGRYIVEFEQDGHIRAEYGKKLLLNLSRDLTSRQGKGFSRSNLTYMRKLYIAFPKRETLSHKLTWSHYFELLKCEDEMEMQFYYNEAINQRWKVRELKRQIKSSSSGTQHRQKRSNGISTSWTTNHVSPRHSPRSLCTGIYRIPS